MPKMPYEQWFWNDWFADDAVTEMDLKSRCVWFYLLGRMHQRQTTYIEGNISELARLAYAREAEVKSAIKNIGEKNVGIVEKNGQKYRIICKRDMRKAYDREQEAERLREWRSKQESRFNPVSNSFQDETPQRFDTRANTSEVQNDNKENIKESEEESGEAKQPETPETIPGAEEPQKPVVCNPQGRERKPFPRSEAELLEAAEATGYPMSRKEASDFLQRYAGNSDRWEFILSKWKVNQSPTQRSSAMRERRGEPEPEAYDPQRAALIAERDAQRKAIEENRKNRKYKTFPVAEKDENNE